MGSNSDNTDPKSCGCGSGGCSSASGSSADGSSAGGGETAGPLNDRGVQNPRVVDLITFDRVADRVILLMIEHRPWGSDPKQLDQLQEKLNNYLDYVLDGYLTKQYPDYLGKVVRIQLEAPAPPEGEAAELVKAIEHYLKSIRIEFEERVQ